MAACKLGHEHDGKHCPTCRREWYLNHKEEEKASNQRWIRENATRYKAKRLEYRKANPEKIKGLWKKYTEEKPLLSVWRSMIRRCTNPKCDSFARYGGRGITVCSRWSGENGYENFVADVPPRPSLEHSIERMDNNGNYEPGNVTWATRSQQQRNRRSNVLITICGRTQCLMDWSRESGIGFKTLQKRYRTRFNEATFLLPPDPRYQTIGSTGYRKRIL